MAVPGRSRHSHSQTPRSLPTRKRYGLQEHTQTCENLVCFRSKLHSLTYVHRGGGNDDNPHLNRTRPPLRWMFAEASAAGLHFEPFRRNFGEKDDIRIGKESLTFAWRAFEHLPFRRLTYNEGTSDRHWTDHCWIPVEILLWILWKLTELLLVFLWVLWKLVVDRGAVWRRLRLLTSRQESKDQEGTERRADLMEWYVVYHAYSYSGLNYALRPPHQSAGPDG